MPDGPQRTGTLEWLVRSAGILLRPLQAALTADELRKLLCLETGVIVPEGALVSAEVTSALSNVAFTASQLANRISVLTSALSADDSGAAAEAAGELLEAVGATVAAVPGIAQALQGPLPGVSDAQLQAFKQDLAARILEILSIRYLDEYLIGRSWLVLLGLLDQALVPSDPTDATQPSFVREQLHVERALHLLNAPLSHARSAYGWGEAAFRAELLLARLQRVLTDYGLTATFTPATTNESASVEFLLCTVREYRDTPLPGIELELKVPISAGLALRLPLVGGFAVEISSTGAFESGLKLVVAPPAKLTWQPVSAMPDGSLQLRLVGESDDPAKPFVLLGATGGSRLEAKQLSVGASVSGHSTAGGAVLLEAAIVGGRIVLDTSEGDRFLASFLSGRHLEADLDVGLVWTPENGLRFKGGVGLEAILPVNRVLGPLNIHTIHLSAALDPNASRVPVEISGALSGDLGPLKVTVDRFGVEAQISFPHTGGNLGPLDFHFGFKPPTGIGLEVDAEFVSGGGFLEYERRKHEYRGVLTLSLWDIGICAYGLLETQLPSGRYSFVAAVATAFTAIPLGLGFTLNGVGGLVGISRRLDTAALANAIRGAGSSEIFFAEDPVVQAARMLGDLARFFPPTEDRYVFGPAVKLGWGTPTLVQAELAILLEVPAPVRAVLLGSLRTALPSKEHAVIDLQIDVLGELDVAGKRISIDASLRDSKVAGFPIVGDFALRASWGEQPMFIASVGGFHSQFRAPVGFPTLRRVRIPIGADDNPRLDIQGFLAVTSSTLQVGAQAELYAAVGPLNVLGSVAFEALIQRSPFGFAVDLSAGVALRRGTKVLAGVHFEGRLRGPRPWHVAGEACLSLWLVDLCVDFSATFGSSQPVELPARAIWPVLRPVLEDPRSWAGALPAGASRVVTTAPPIDATAEVARETRLDPGATVTVRQSVVPLNRRITRFAQGTPTDVTEVKVTAATIGSQNVSFPPVTDWFPTGEFEVLTEAEKLSREGFERMDAGVELASAPVAGSEQVVPLEYETVIVAPEGATRGPRYRPTLAAQLLAGQTGTREAPPRLIAPGGLPEETFVIASADTLEAVLYLAPPGPRWKAEQALAAYLAAHPGQADALVVVPSFEVAA